MDLMDVEEPEGKSLLESIHDFAEIANAAASLLVGHRSILISGGIDPVVVDHMIYNLHCKLLATGEWDYFSMDEFDPEFDEEE